MPFSTLHLIPIKSGAISFPGCTDSFIQIPYEENMRLNTNDFTIEWFQYMEHAPSNDKQTVFAIGRPPNCAIGVTFFFKNSNSKWNMGFHLNGHNYFICSVDIINEWVHFAISRKDDIILIFKDGIEIESIDIDYSLDYSNQYISLGNIFPPSKRWAFKGCISNFRWTPNKCVYDKNFSVPTSTLKPLCETKLLLLMKTKPLALKDLIRNVNTIEIIEGRHISPPEDSVQGANKIMWIETSPFSST
jgi:hypothetical protein